MKLHVCFNNGLRSWRKSSITVRSSGPSTETTWIATMSTTAGGLLCQTSMLSKRLMISTKRNASGLMEIVSSHSDGCAFVEIGRSLGFVHHRQSRFFVVFSGKDANFFPFLKDISIYFCNFTAE